MKPRFSILTLLGITAYVAVNAIVFASPSDATYSILLWAWLGALLWTTIVAGSTADQRRRVFASSFVACAALCTLTDFHIQNTYLDWADLPIQIVVSLIAGPPLAIIPDQMGEAIQRENQRQFVRLIVGINGSLTIGLLGGYMTLWRYRVLERRAKEKDGMKPRFSILTLLGITAYVAVAAAAFISPAWHYVFGGVWALALSAAAIVATGRTSEQSVFARGLLLGGLVGFFMFSVHPIGVTDLPRLLASYGVYWKSINWSLLYMNVEMACGFIFATLALWLYRVLELRAKKEKVE